jgi:hypothetical protein
MNNKLLLTFLFLSLFARIAFAEVHEASSDYKWYPGHYVFQGDNSGLESMYDEISPYPLIRGIQTRYYWNDLETSKGNYDFSIILNDLDYMQSKGKYLIIQLQFKSFNSNSKPFPAYLQTSEYDGGIFEIDKGGWGLRLWNNNVMTRLKALLTALGNAIDNHPALAMVNSMETALGGPLDPVLQSNWTNLFNTYLQNLSGCAVTMRSSFPATPTISYFNSGQTHSLIFEQDALATGQGHGGPDTYIGAYENDLWLRHGYNLGQRLASKVPIGYAVQWNNYIWVGASSKWEDPRGAVPPVEIYEFSRDVLMSNFIMWGKRVPYWDNVKALWDSLYIALPGDPAGGLQSGLPTLLGGTEPEVPPGQASGPSIPNGATGVSINPSLSWIAGSGTSMHKVHFGTNSDPPLVSTQSNSIYNPGTLDYNTTYFWRIDEENLIGTTTGNLWSFTTAGMADTATELLVFDFNRPVVEEDRGFPKAEMVAKPANFIEAMLPGSNENWEIPINYSEGTLHMRAEVFSQPVPQDMRLQFCIWQDDLEGNRFGLETCTPLANVSGTEGTVVTWSRKVQNMWKKDGKDLDWTRPRERYGVAIKNMAGDPVSDYLGWNWNGENPVEWYPLDMRFTVVASAKDMNFSGWTNYVSPVDDTPVERGLTAYWSFNQLSDGKVPDGSSFGNDLSLSGEAGLQEGHYGQGLYLPGTSPSYAFINDADLCREFPSSNKGLPVDSLTIAAWIRLNSIDDRNTVITKEIQDKRGFEFGVKNGYLAVQIFKDEGTGTLIENKGTRLEIGRWYHIAMTYNYVGDTNSVIRLYLDGELDEMHNNVTGPLKKNDAAVRVGHYTWGSSYQRFFNGMIDELYVFNKTLSADDILLLMNSTYLPVGITRSDFGVSDFMIYPNPVSSTFFYKGMSKENGKLRLTIHNMKGQVIETVLDKYMSNGPFSGAVQIDHLPDGIYFITLKTDNTFSTLKFVKI